MLNASSTTISLPIDDFQDKALMAAAGFLSSYSGTTRVGYTFDLKGWWVFCEANKFAPFDAQRVHVEVYVRQLEEKGYARSTIGRRLSTVGSFYKWCLQEELIPKNPALYVRRPKIDQESTTLGLDRQELGQFLATLMRSFIGGVMRSPRRS